MQKRFNKKNYLFILCINIILSFLFYNAHYWTSKTPVYIKCRTYVVLVFMIGIIPLIAGFFSKSETYFDKLIYKIKFYYIQCKINKKKAIKVLVAYVLCIILAYPLSKVFIRLVNIILPQFGYNIIVWFCFIVANMVCITCWIFRKKAYDKIHILFAIVALIEGGFFCVTVPAEVGISWDDEIHYQHVADMVNYFDGQGYTAESLLIDRYQKVAIAHYGYKYEERISLNNELNDSFSNKEIGKHTETYSISNIAYIPYCVGVIVGRGLDLSYTSTFILGKIFNMLFYITLCSIAIKKIASGKILLMMVALFPTTMYMAGSYSYDPWITAFSLLGFSLFFNILHDEEKVEFDIIIKMLLCFIIGFIIKPVYFPSLFFLLFIPKNRFTSQKAHKIYIGLVFLTAFLLAFAIVAPIIFSGNGMGTGDTRGGSEVNSNEQLKFILDDPVRYIDILFRFFKGYLSPLNSGHYIQNYAYMSYWYQAPFMKINLLVVILVVLLDSINGRNSSMLVRSTGFFGQLCTVILIASALYISYTPVGLDTVNGCQFRYLTPLFFPFTYLLNINNQKQLINKNVLTLIVAFFFAATFVFWTGGNLYAGYSGFMF